MNAPVFTQAQLDALTDLSRVWREQRFFLLGATALACHLDRRWRATEDLDFALAVDLADFPAVLDGLSGDRPDEREKDLQDLGYVLDEYVEPYDERRFNGEVPEPFEHEEVGAFLLGRDLRTIDAGERAALNDFLARVRDPNDKHQAQTILLRGGPPRWQGEPEKLIRLLDALEQGLKLG